MLTFCMYSRETLSMFSTFALTEEVHFSPDPLQNICLSFRLLPSHNSEQVCERVNGQGEGDNMRIDRRVRRDKQDWG
jgi:hypothetical protein